MHNASDARITTFDKIEEMASTVEGRCDGTHNFPRAETVSVAMQTSDAYRSRDECFHGRTQLRPSVTEDFTPQENSCVTVRDCEEDDDQRFRSSRIKFNCDRTICRKCYARLPLRVVK